MTENAHFDHNPKTDYTKPSLTPQHQGYAEDEFGSDNVVTQQVAGSPETPEATPTSVLFAITGTPRGDLGNIDDSETVRILRSEAERVMDNVEVTHLSNISVIPNGMMQDVIADMTQDHPDPEAVDLIKGIAFSGALMETAMGAMERYEEAAEAKRVSSQTPEEIAEEDARRLAWVRNLHKEAYEQSEKARTDSLALFYGTAQKWATLPELNATERCHGVAHDLYLKFGPHGGSDGNGRHVDFNRSDDYAKHFDHNFADQIRMRHVRAAKELFGEP